MNGPAGGRGDERTQQLLIFNLAEEAYGVDILRVREVRRWEAARAVPNLPKHIKGVINLCGDMVPVTDLRVRFRSGPAVYRATTVVIVVSIRWDGCVLPLGLVVDGVTDVLLAAQQEIKPSPGFGARVDARFISGMVAAQGRTILLLDADRLLDGDELDRLESA